MLGEISVRQWLMWKAYLQLEPPPGAEAASYTAALIAQAIWNVQIAKGTPKGETPKMRKLHEFVLRFGDMPDPTPPPAPVSASEQFGRLVDSFAALGMQPVNKT